VSPKPPRVLVTGATGFIGGRLCEVMTLTGGFTPRPLVHSTGASWRIARFPMDFAFGDLCDAGSVDRAMQGCDAVVHLARGGKTVMRRGLENVLRAAVKHGASRVVHISSVAVYGNNPPAESAFETARAKRTDLPYGNEKLEQEHRALRYWKRHGLEVVILRPPSVYGPFSSFTMAMINSIRGRVMAIVDGGRNPCNLVYVDNLVEAILLALWRPEAPGQTFFVTDGETVSWERCITDQADLVGLDVARVRATDLVRSPQERVVRDSFRALPAVVADGELRRVLARIPVFKRANDLFYGWFTSLSERTRQTIRLSLRGPEHLGRNGSSEHRFDADFNLIANQGRTVAHCSEKARRLLGYTAPVSYEEGMQLTEAWLREARIIDRNGRQVSSTAGSGFSASHRSASLSDDG
jgi:nucleoside-diphosphate-sugar epimerase